MLAGILSVLVFVLYLVIIELNKNILLSFVIAVAGLIAALFLIKKKRCFVGFGAMLVLFAAGFIFTQPGEKRVPAFDSGNMDVTEVIHTDKGDLTGVYNEDHSVRAYAGIPYAAPPVGENRFREPQEVQPWDGVLECSSFGPMAMQQRDSALMDSLYRIVGYGDYEIKIGDEYREAMSEDCLYLNIFAPDEKSEELLPVVIYVHGGSLTTGHPSYIEYRGEDMAKRGVIYVNFAYRLGAFGYYAADDLKEESPNNTTGNYGLLDQAAAVKWVHDNIELFGGDPDRITIAGESAGSSSVNALCVSPLTEGMFEYCIAESSGINVKKPFHTFRDYEEAISEGDKLREEFNVSSSDELRSIPAQKLVYNNEKNSSMTIDGYAITEAPYLTYEKGNNHEKALLNGFNLKEADAFMMDVEATKENYVNLLAEDLGDEYAKKMAEVIPYDYPQRDKYYIVDKKGEAKGALNAAYSAMWFSYSHYVWSGYMVDQKRPCYEYYFTKTNKAISNNHAGELPYAYGNLHRHKGIYDDSDYELSEMMISYFTNFIKTGDPNAEGLPVWEARSSENDRVLNLDTEVIMVDDPNTEAYNVIDEYMNSEE